MYELEKDAIPQPDLHGGVVVAPTEDELIDRIAADLVIHAENCVRQFGDFHLALSGDPVFEDLYRRLMYDPDFRRLPWRRTHLWLVDEWCVPFDDERSRFRLLSETIGDHADIPQEQVHPIFPQSARADRDYEDEFREALGWREKGQDRLDYVLLTIGDGGCPAGLLPGSSTGSASDRLVQRTIPAAAEAMERVALTLPFINAARFVAVMITGEAVGDVIERLTSEEASSSDLPATGLAPLNGELRWYLDAAACGAGA